MKLPKIPRSWIRIITISLLIVASVWWVKDYGLINKVKELVDSLAPVRKHAWILKTAKTHLRCGHSEISEKIFSSKARLKDAFPGDPAVLEDKNNYSYSWPVPIDDLCQSCKNNQFLSIRDQEVVIVKGTPQKPGPIAEKTSIKVTRLPEVEIRDLTSGIPFRNGKEKLQIIEGLNAN